MPSNEFDARELGFRTKGQQSSLLASATPEQAENDRLDEKRPEPQSSNTRKRARARKSPTVKREPLIGGSRACEGAHGATGQSRSQLADPEKSGYWLLGGVPPLP